MILLVPMNFIPNATGPDHQPEKALYFILNIRHIVVNGPNVPEMDKPHASKFSMGEAFFFGTFKGTPCYCAELQSKTVPEPFEKINLRAYFLSADDTFREMAGYARQVLDLHLNFRFCGRCGGPTRTLTHEHARVCPSCHLTAYPRISPAVIMSVTKGDKILLGKGVNFPDKKMFSVLAGFVSPSETLEDCVRREVFEETSIRVSDIHYVKSQPWPFPDSLMIGFTARYQSGEIDIDPNEIVEAAWFSHNNLPKIPHSHSLAGQLIRSFVREQGSQTKNYSSSHMI